MRRLLSLFLLVGCTLHAAGIWHPHVEFQGRAGDFRRGGGVQFFAPLIQDGDSIFFAQALGGRFIDEWTGSLGLGFREAVNPCWGWGANTFIDVARSELDRTYVQLGVGLELFGPCWLLRGNAYVAEPHRFQESVEFARHIESSGNIIDATRVTTEEALFGGDVEAGYGMCVGKDEVWGFVGGYVYEGPTFNTLAGPRVRGEYRWKDACHWEGVQVTVAGEYQWDHFHKHQGSAIVTVKMPLGRMPRRNRCCDMSVCQRLGESVYRQPGIWTRGRVQTFERTTEETGLFFVALNGTGSGATQSDPTNIEAVKGFAVLPGDAIVLLSTEGNPILQTTAPYMLLSDQTMAAFLAGQASITVNVRGRPVVVKNQDTTSPAVVFGNSAGGSDLLSLAGGNEVFGFNTSTADTAIVSTSATNLSIHDMTITAPADTAIDLSGGNGVTIEDVTITGLPDGIDGISFAGKGLTVKGATSITGPGTGTGTGIVLSSATNVSIQGSKATPISIMDMGNGLTSTGGSELTVEFLTAEGIVTDGLNINGLNTGAFDNVMIDGAGTTAADFTSTGGTIKVQNGLFSSITGPVFRIDTNHGNFDFASTGIFNGAGATPTIGLEIVNSGGTISSTGSQGSNTITMGDGGQALNISGGTSTIDLGTFDISAADYMVPGIEISGVVSGAITLGQISLPSGMLTQPTAAIDVAGSPSATLTFGPATLLNTAGRGIVIDTWGTVTFPTSSINEITATDGAGLRVTDVNNFTGTFNLINSSGSSDHGIFLMGNENMTLTVKGGTISSPMMNGIKGDIVGPGTRTFDSMKIESSTDSGILLDDVQGTWTFSGMEIDMPGKDGLEVTFVANPTVNFSGTITSPTDNGILADMAPSGTYNVSNTTITGAGMSGIAIDSSSGNWNISNATITSPTDHGISAMTFGSGTVNITNSNLSSIPMVGILVDTAGGTWKVDKTMISSDTTCIDLTSVTDSFTVISSELEAEAMFGINVTNSAGQSPTYNFTANAIFKKGAANTTGVNMTLTGSSTKTTMAGNTFTGLFDGIFVTQVDSPTNGSDVIKIDENTFQELTTGGAIGIVSGARGAIAFSITRNVFSLPTTAGGINTSFVNPAGETLIVNGLIDQLSGMKNEITGGLSQPIIGQRCDFSTASSVANLEVSNTVFKDLQAQDVRARNVGTAGTMNLTLLSNSDLVPAAGATPLVFDIENGAGTTCVTMTGNNTARPKTGTPQENILISGGAGTCNVTNLPSLSSNNNGMDVSVSGATNVTTNCPRPVIP